MIQVKALTKQFGSQILFENVNFQIGSGEKIGLVGRNGSGKTTIFKLILGKMLPDVGEIAIPNGYTIGTLEQHIHFSQSTLLKEVSQTLKSEEKYDWFKAEKILFGLGFGEEDLKKDPQSFSGGYQIRINLAKALLRKPNLLLLDEPTNYLDIVSLRWLSRFLKSFHGEIILITHDRNFMDSITSHTMGIHRQVVRKMKGSTEKYYRQLFHDEDIFEKTRQNEDKKRKELARFIERFKAKATKARQAQSRVKQLMKIHVEEKLTDEPIMDFSFRFSPIPAKEILRIEKIHFDYHQQPSSYLINNFSVCIKKNDRIGIIGKNGKGKSTLLNLLAGELHPQKGEIKKHPKLKIGHFGQTNVNRLVGTNSIIDEISSSNPNLSISATRGICGALMFSGEIAEKKIKVLSGGEKSRVLLGKILAHQSNLLLLDEPTNHLDMESATILGDEIASFKGAVVIVTHNEYLLRTFANKLIVFQGGNGFLFDGTYDDFLEKIGWDEEIEEDDLQDKSGSNWREVKRQKAELIKNRSKELTPLKEEMEKLEYNIEKLEQFLELCSKEIIESSKTGDKVQLKIASIKYKEAEDKIEEFLDRLQTITTEYETLEKRFDTRLEDLTKD